MSADHDTTDDAGTIACPWCGHPHSDLWEHQLGDGDATTIECEECEEEWELSCEVTTSYTGSREVPK